MDKLYQQALEEKNILTKQLQAKTDMCAKAEEIRDRLLSGKHEMEENIVDMEARIKEEEEKVIKSADDKKKLQQHIQVSPGCMDAARWAGGCKSACKIVVNMTLRC